MFLVTSNAAPIIDRQPSNKEELKIEGRGRAETRELPPDHFLDRGMATKSKGNTAKEDPVVVLARTSPHHRILEQTVNL